MNTPCCGALVAHHKDVFGKLVDSCSRICPYVVEESKRVNVQLGFNWKLSKEKVQTGGGRVTA